MSQKSSKISFLTLIFYFFLSLSLKEASSSSSAARCTIQCASSYPRPPPPFLFFLPPPSRAPSCYIPPSPRCHGNMSDCRAICSALSSRWAPFCCASACSCVFVRRQKHISPSRPLLLLLPRRSQTAARPVSERAAKYCKRVMLQTILKIHHIHNTVAETE